MSILSNFYCPNIVLEEEYSFSESGDYKVNDDVSLQAFHLVSLTLQVPPYSKFAIFIVETNSAFEVGSIQFFLPHDTSKRGKTFVQLLSKHRRYY